MAAKPHRRWYQFSLRTLLVSFTVLAIVSAITGYFVHIWNDGEEGRRMQRMNDLILNNGGYWEVGESVDMGNATATQLDTVLAELSTFDNQIGMSFVGSEFGDAHVKHLLGHHGLKGQQTTP